MPNGAIQKPFVTQSSRKFAVLSHRNSSYAVSLFSLSRQRMAKISPKDRLKNTNHTLAALLLLASCTCCAQSASTPSRPSASGVIGTPDPDIARQIFPDVPDQSNDILIAASSDNDAVRIGVRGHESTVQ